MKKQKVENVVFSCMSLFLEYITIDFRDTLKKKSACLQLIISESIHYMMANTSNPIVHKNGQNPVKIINILLWF